MFSKVILVTAAAAVLAAGGARAQPPGKDDGSAAGRAEAAGRSTGERQRRTILHFGEDDIRGDITRPDGELVQAPRKLRDASLLRVRRSFIDRALSAPLLGR